MNLCIQSAYEPSLLLVHTNVVSLAFAARAAENEHLAGLRDYNAQSNLPPGKLCLEGVQICSLSTTSFIAVDLDCHRTYGSWSPAVGTWTWTTLAVQSVSYPDLPELWRLQVWYASTYIHRELRGCG